MTWCDKLASTPIIGLKFDYHFMPSTEMLAAMTPILDQLVDGDKIKFAITKQDALSLTISTDEGFQYGFDQSRMWVEFQHKMRLRPTSGGPPMAELTSEPLPYSDLLVRCSKRILNASDLILKAHPRKLVRIGIVSTTLVDNDDLPPGMSRFVKYVTRPWGGTVEQYSFQMTAELDRNDEWFDRCLHTVIRTDDPEQPLSLQFDWHRTLVAPRPASPGSIQSLLTSAEDAANAYFEDLAVGNRFDENILGGSA